MKKVTLLVALCAAAFVMTGCIATHTNDAASGATACVSKNFEADIVAGKTQAKGSAAVHSILGLITWGVSDYADDAFVSGGPSLQLFASPLTVVKQGATYNACTGAKADMLLAAKYNIKVKDYFVYQKIECDVTGFPGVVKGIK